MLVESSVEGFIKISGLASLISVGTLFATQNVDRIRNERQTVETQLKYEIVVDLV